MNKKANNVIRIPTSVDKFFKYWILFTRPLHNLTEKEMEVTACILKYRYNLSKVIIDENVLDVMLFGEDTRNKIKAECDISSAFFQVILGKLRKVNIIKDNKINPRFIPNFKKVEDFKLLLYFDIDEAE